MAVYLSLFSGLAAVIFIVIEAVILLILDGTTCCRSLKSCRNTPKSTDKSKPDSSTSSENEQDDFDQLSLVSPRDLLQRDVFV